MKLNVFLSSTIYPVGTFDIKVKAIAIKMVTVNIHPSSGVEKAKYIGPVEAAKAKKTIEKAILARSLLSSFDILIFILNFI